ncbi:MAG: hypothetical protein DMG75_00540 [Acidobacteria bacterium]|nr:MAG: hypothetical protein DMG75_00540 [Acidobacteriota bacterium]
MACSLCGDVCRCNPAASPATTRSRFQPKPEPEVQAGGTLSEDTVLVDPDAADTSEQQFAASLELEQVDLPRFVMDENGSVGGQPEATVTEVPHSDAPQEFPEPVGMMSFDGEDRQVPRSLQDASDLARTADSWRDEVAARVHRYQSRRKPRGPRPVASSVQTQPSHQALAVEYAEPTLTASPVTAEITGRLIEFPRSFLPPIRLNELADPVIDRPRILEAPEIVHPPPALGGILMEPAEERPAEKRPGFEIPLQSAATSHRLLAAAVDALGVIAATGLFGWIFFKLAEARPVMPRIIGLAAALTFLFWAAYQYLFVVYTGSTPGLKLAKLQLTKFDGSLANRRLRRWRVLASVLSALSLGMGFAWCFLDEDALCWHDRITHTYLGPRAEQ